jgi:pSer/pThr/pTyr-binding forkhead associated (FHA) protein
MAFEEGSSVDIRVDVMIMSGVEDGVLHKFDSASEGERQGVRWTLKIGRKEENDLCLRNDTYVSRLHGKLHWQDHHWWLEDCDSTNGTFVENEDHPLDDRRVFGTVQLELGQVFRVGRTWLKLQASE